MRRAGEPQTEGQEELAIVLGHRRDNPDRGQQAVEQERPKHDIAQRIRDGGSGGVLSRGRWRGRCDYAGGSYGHSGDSRIGSGGRTVDGHMLCENVPQKDAVLQPYLPSRRRYTSLLCGL